MHGPTRIPILQMLQTVRYVVSRIDGASRRKTLPVAVQRWVQRQVQGTGTERVTPVFRDATDSPHGENPWP